MSYSALLFLNKKWPVGIFSTMKVLSIFFSLKHKTTYFNSIFSPFDQIKVFLQKDKHVNIIRLQISSFFGCNQTSNTKDSFRWSRCCRYRQNPFCKHPYVGILSMIIHKQMNPLFFIILVQLFCHNGFNALFCNFFLMCCCDRICLIVNPVGLGIYRQQNSEWNS